MTRILTIAMLFVFTYMVMTANAAIDEAGRTYPQPGPAPTCQK